MLTTFKFVEFYYAESYLDRLRKIAVACSTLISSLGHTEDLLSASPRLCSLYRCQDSDHSGSVVKQLKGLHSDGADQAVFYHPKH